MSHSRKILGKSLNVYRLGKLSKRRNVEQKQTYLVTKVVDPYSDLHPDPASEQPDPEPTSEKQDTGLIYEKISDPRKMINLHFFLFIYKKKKNVKLGYYRLSI